MFIYNIIASLEETSAEMWPNGSNKIILNAFHPEIKIIIFSFFWYAAILLFTFMVNNHPQPNETCNNVSLCSIRRRLIQKVNFILVQYIMHRLQCGQKPVASNKILNHK